jgi:hypothetical protein
MTIFYLNEDDENDAQLVASATNQGCHLLQLSSSSSVVNLSESVTLFGHSTDSRDTLGGQSASQIAAFLVKIYEKKNPLTINLLTCEGAMKTDVAFGLFQRAEFAQALANALGAQGVRAQVIAIEPPQGAVAMRVSIDQEPGLADRRLGAKEGQVRAIAYGNKDTEAYEDTLSALNQQYNESRVSPQNETRQEKTARFQQQTQVSDEIKQHKESKQDTQNQVIHLMADRDYGNDYRLMMQAKGKTFRALNELSPEQQHEIKRLDAIKSRLPVSNLSALKESLMHIDTVINRLIEGKITPEQSGKFSSALEDKFPPQKLSTQQQVEEVVTACLDARLAEAIFDAESKKKKTRSFLMSVVYTVLSDPLDVAEQTKTDALEKESEITTSSPKTEAFLTDCLVETETRLQHAQEELNRAQESGGFTKLLIYMGLVSDPSISAHLSVLSAEKQKGRFEQDILSIKNQNKSMLTDVNNTFSDFMSRFTQVLVTGVTRVFGLSNDNPIETINKKLDKYVNQHSDKNTSKQAVGKALHDYVNGEHTHERWRHVLAVIETNPDYNKQTSKFALWQGNQAPSTLGLIFEEVENTFPPSGEPVSSKTNSSKRSPKSVTTEPESPSKPSSYFHF